MFPMCVMCHYSPPTGTRAVRPMCAVGYLGPGWMFRVLSVRGVELKLCVRTSRSSYIIILQARHYFLHLLWVFSYTVRVPPACLLSCVRARFICAPCSCGTVHSPEQVRRFSFRVLLAQSRRRLCGLLCAVILVCSASCSPRFGTSGCTDLRKMSPWGPAFRGPFSAAGKRPPKITKKGEARQLGITFSGPLLRPNSGR